MTAQPLNPLSLPLYGERLIEASAGTGKTYTIAALYLRLLLGLGGEAAFTRPLRVDEILVVTFTEAATGELRERIRARIREGRLLLMQMVQQPALRDLLLAEKGKKDPLLAQMMDIAPADCTEAAQTLLAAERQMDEAAIYTIHGFCQRMLTQNAFESGSLFEQTLVTDEQSLVRQVVTDFWRRHFYPLSRDMAAVISQEWSSPEALQHEVVRYLSGPAPRIHRHGEDTDLAARHQQIVAQLDALKQAWLANAGEIEALIAGSGIAKNKYRGDWVSKWVGEITAWAMQPTRDYRYPDSLARFAQSRLHEATKKGECPSLALFDQVEQLCEQTLTLRDIVLAQAIAELRGAMQRHKLERGEMSFDDLLTRLSQALQQESGQALAEAIRQRYPLAMIDEFQDTDPQQYHIFHTLYGGRSDTGLLMIGDPKQAIYAFRGADIFTYIEARRNVSAHYTLDTNWRSSAGMVDAVNRLFSLSPDPFLFRADIPFSPVQASPAASGLHFTLEQQVQPALTLCRLPVDRCNSGDYQQQMAAACADSIAGWLQAGAEGRGQIVRGDKSRPVQAQDIAVLVRTGREAALVRQALSARGVASVYLSNRDSVFGTAEATDLLRLLQACLQPGQERLLRAALASSLLGLSAAQLDALNQDEERWEKVVAEFEMYRRCWQRQGVLPMLHLVLRERELAETLLAGADGERRLTNVLHLGELLQEAAAELDSEHALLRWFALQLAEPAYGSDEQQLRLESDAHLVKIVTIHKSKGLEYGLVWLPFACGFRKADGSLYHDDSLQPVLDLTGDPLAAECAEYERLAEDIRLIYVALTRAIYHCQVGVAALTVGNGKRDSTDVHQSAFGYLLQRGEAGDAALLDSCCSHLCEVGGGNVALAGLPEAAQFMPPVSESAPTLAAAQFTGHIDRNWWITSYSHLSRHQEAVDWLPHFDQDAAGEQPASAAALAAESVVSPENSTVLAVAEADMAAEWLGTLAVGSTVDGAIDSSSDNASDKESDWAGKPTSNADFNEIASSDPAQSTEPDAPEIEYSPFTFPRGARPGTFLHSLFETLEFTAPDTWSAPLALMSDAHGLDAQWQPVLQHWLTQVLSTPLDGEALTLNQIGPQDRRVELEFYLPIDSPLHAARLDSLCRRYDPLTRQAPQRLEFASVQGMLKGFIDLVFRWQGRFYVLDYKSNYLGDTAADYAPDALARAMLDHRYDLQYQLYTLALHRYLKTRVPDYDYERHIGGVYYLFLRGMQGADSNGDEQHGANGVFYCRPDVQLINELDQLFAASSDAAVAGE